MLHCPMLRGEHVSFQNVVMIQALHMVVIGPLMIDLHQPVLEKYAENAAQTTRATSQGSPPAPPSTPIAEPPDKPMSMSLAEAGMTNGDEFEEKDDDGVDILSTPEVTIPRPTTARTQENLAAPQINESSSTKKRQTPASKKTSSKTASSLRRRWSHEDLHTLRTLCDGKAEALQWPSSPFWVGVAGNFPGRTQTACAVKWSRLQGPHFSWDKGATHGSGAPTADAAKRYCKWSPDELEQLVQCLLEPEKVFDWEEVASKIPGRGAQACYVQFKRKLEAQGFRPPMGVHFQGTTTSGAEKANGESG